MQLSVDKRTTAARAFVRSLNILLKFARMYDFGHPRTAKQYETAWAELRTALGDTEAGLLLAVSGDQLLLDGTPLESAAAEKSFARMLSAAGIASIFFSSKVTQTSLAKLVRGFPTGTGARPAQLAQALKAALQGDPHIHVNEVCFVPADSAVAKTTVAAQLAARTLGLSSAEQDEMLQDPEKLLQLILAAEGMKDAGSGSGGPGGEGGSGEGENRWHRGNAAGGGSGSGGSGLGGRGFGRGEGTGTGGGAPGGQPAGSGDGTPGQGSGRSALGRDAAAPQGGPRIEGPVAPVAMGGEGTGAEGLSHGSGAGSVTSGSGGENTWNIVGGEGSGTPLDASAGGFWFNAEGGDQSSSKPGGRGTGRGQGAANPTVGGRISSIGTRADAGTSDGELGGASGIGGGAEARGSGWGGHGRGGSGSGHRGRGTEATSLGRWESTLSSIAGSHSARPATSGGMTAETGLMTLQGDELQGILQVLAQMGGSDGEKFDPTAFQSRLSSLPRRAHFTVSQALAALAAQAPTETSDKAALMKLAEHIAVRYALENYERGNLKVNAVQEVLDQMNQELDGLRKVLGVYEQEMSRAGIAMPSQTDLLAREFWAQVSEEKKKAVLESSDAWCVPPAKISEYVGVLRSNGENETADRVLRNYANCISSKAPQARRQTATGLAELAAVYAAGDERLLVDTIRQAGVQLAEETDSELQSLVSAAFVRLSQEAGKKRSYLAIQRSVELASYIEDERPSLGKNLRPRIAVENRLPEFIDEAVRTGEIPGGLKDLLRRVPILASEQIAKRFTRAGFREDCELLISMMQMLGPEALDHMRQVLRHGSAGEAVDMIGILARMDIDAAEQILPVRMSEWKRTAHDRVVRQIAASGSPERGQLLLKVFDYLDTLIQPLAVDEIGMSGEQGADTRFLLLAEGDMSKGGTEYLRLKAIEALGRLRTVAAEAALRKIAEARKAFRWAHPSELRLVAAQAMEKIDPEWVRSFVPRSGLSTAEFSIEPLDPDPNSSAIRQRRYPRLRMERPVPATTTTLKENCNVEIPELTLGGGVAVCEQSLHPGSVVGLRMNAGQKTIKAQTIVRDANAQARAFEVVDISLEERAKLRKILVQLGNALKKSTPQERSRRTTRTILSNSSEK